MPVDIEVDEAVRGRMRRQQVAIQASLTKIRSELFPFLIMRAPWRTYTGNWKPRRRIFRFRENAVRNIFGRKRIKPLARLAGDTYEQLYRFQIEPNRQVVIVAEEKIDCDYAAVVRAMFPELVFVALGGNVRISSDQQTLV
jgi:hypothetical protein